MVLYAVSQLISSKISRSVKGKFKKQLSITLNKKNKNNEYNHPRKSHSYKSIFLTNKCVAKLAELLEHIKLKKNN